MSNFRPAKCCYHCVHKTSNHCKFDIPDKAVPGVPQGITMRNAVCDLFDWPDVEDDYIIQPETKQKIRVKIKKGSPIEPLKGGE